MQVDVEGRFYCTGPGGRWVFDAEGNHLGVIVLPKVPANCARDGDDNRTMLFHRPHLGVLAANDHCRHAYSPGINVPWNLKSVNESPSPLLSSSKGLSLKGEGSFCYGMML